MRAILLAAGRGRRLGKDHPKVLLDVGGKTLLARHLENMPEAGIDRLTIVVGFLQDQIRAELAKLRPAIPVEVVENPRFMNGSIVSLQVAGERLLEGAVWMDADVLYPALLLRRLVASAHANCVLLDGRSEESGEEMMVGVRGGRAAKIARRVGDGWDFRGESVGFFKVDAAGGAAMKRRLDAEVAAGRLDQEYEAALDACFGDVAFGHERADDVPWTEIDFEEDVVKARALAAELAR
ncbi:MAG TPA: phosphocholine cytidylyltransferase family protein [Minicystis sp.]|nr:phosphocholine cytidylyltransferase family protein [Minicystis sp.]